jgi:hypothetical protein
MRSRPRVRAKPDEAAGSMGGELRSPLSRQRARDRQPSKSGFSAPTGREDAVRGGKERSAGRIEVVGVLVMREQHDIDRVLSGDVECRPCQLGEAAVFTGGARVWDRSATEARRTPESLSALPPTGF